MKDKAGELFHEAFLAEFIVKLESILQLLDGVLIEVVYEKNGIVFL